MNFAIKIAREIINMSYEIEKLQDEVNELNEYKKKYDELLSNGLSHNQKMTDNLLSMLLVPEVSKAFTNNTNPENFETKKSTDEY